MKKKKKSSRLRLPMASFIPLALTVGMFVAGTPAVLAEPTSIDNWQAISSALEGDDYNYTATDYVLTKDIEVTNPEDIASFHANDNGVNLDLGGHTISVSGKRYDSIIDVGQLSFETGDYSKGELRIYNGTIENFTHHDTEWSTGAVIIENCDNVKELNINFANNNSDFGSAITNYTNLNQVTTQEPYHSSIVENVSGNFTNNHANYFGGAIVNTGANVIATYDPNNFSVMDMEIVDMKPAVDLNTQMTITTKGKDTVFENNSAEIAGGAIFNAGTLNIKAQDGNKVIFKTASDTIYNVGVLNITNGETILNSEISDKPVEVSMLGFSNTKLGNTGILNIYNPNFDSGDENNWAELTLGDGATITQNQINVKAGGHLTAEYANNKITGNLIIEGSNNPDESAEFGGSADLHANAITSKVINNGDLALKGGTLKHNIEGDGILNIWDSEVINNAKISQKYLEIGYDSPADGYGILTTNLNDLDIKEGKIHNTSILKLTGGTNRYEITSTDFNGLPDGNGHEGSIIIAGNVTNNALIDQKGLEIATNGNFTSSLDLINIKDTIKNDGNFTINGLDLSEAVEFNDQMSISGAGTTTINNNLNIEVADVYLNNVDNNIVVNKNAKLYLHGNLGNNNKTNTAVVNDYGELEVAGVVNSSLIIKKEGEAEVHRIDNIKSDIKNDGFIKLGAKTSGETSEDILSVNITGSGDTRIEKSATVANNATINQASITVQGEVCRWDENGNPITGEILAPASTLTANADSLKTSYAIENGGTLKLTGGTNTNTIINELFEDDSNEDNIYTQLNEGTTVIAGNVINQADIRQKVSVESGNLSTNANHLGDKITNAVIDGLTLTGGTLAQDIEGAGSTQIAGVVTNNAQINQNLTITKDGNLTSTLESLGGTFTNNGTFNLLSNDLSKDIKGTGTTKLTTTTTITGNKTLDGTLDFNNQNVNMKDNTINSINVNKLAGKGNLSIDINNTTSDTITAVNGGENNTIITINELNWLTTDKPTDTTEYKIINGDNVTLALNNSLTNKETLSVVTDDSAVKEFAVGELKQSMNWSDEIGSAEFKVVTTTTKYGQMGLNDSKTSLMYNITSSESSEKGDMIEGTLKAGDVLSLLNQSADFSQKTFTANNSTDIHTVTADFGTTSGTMNVSGKSSNGENSTIDMNGHKGFELKNENTKLNLKNLKITNATSEVVNATSVDSVTTLDNVIFENNSGNSDVVNNGTLNLNNAASKFDKGITGTGSTNINTTTDMQNSKLSQKLINIASKIGLIVKADNLEATDGIKNAGELTLGDGTLKANVSGSGTTTINGNVTNSKTITQNVNIASGSLTTNAQDITGNINNNANNGLILNGGENKNTVSGTGSTKIAGNVVNSAKINQNVDIASGSLESNTENITGTVNIANNATYNIIGGALSSNKITGAGSLLLSNDYTSQALNNFTGDVKIAEGKTLTIGNDLFNNNTLTMADGSTLSLLGQADSVTIDNLAIAGGTTVNLEFDWGDTLNSSSSNINGKLNISQINLASTNGTEETYTFTNLGNKVVYDINKVNLSNVTKDTNNFVTYNSANGELFSKKRTLAIAVDETAINEQSTYYMLESESAGNETLEGTLTIQGNGNAITNKNGSPADGITIGNGTNNATLTLKDVNFDGIKVSNTSGAMHVKGGSGLEIIAQNANIELKGTSGNSNSAIYLEKSGTNIAQATINAENGTITISDDIMSNDKDNKITFKGNKNITFSGKFDPVEATVDMTEAELLRSKKQDENIEWHLNGGTLRYAQDSILSNIDKPNSMSFEGGSLDLRNGAVNEIYLSSINLVKDSNLYLDADLANKTMDTFNVDDVSKITITDNNAKLHVAGFKLISDAIEDNTSINFIDPDLTIKDATNTNDVKLAEFVDYTGSQGITALSPIYRYNVEYDDTTGNFNFSRFVGGGYNSFNPSIFAAPVAAQLGGYLTQLNSYDHAFRNMDMYMLMTKRERQALKLRNKYASTDARMVFDPTGTTHDDTAVWYRPYATFESVGLKGGAKVNNTAYGSFFGGESQMYDLGAGWDGMWGAYVGYNGSHQTYDGVGIYQNGGTLGFVGMAYKDNFFTGLTLNAGANAGRASTIFGDEDFTLLMAGIASKTGYNWELADGKFIIQPSLLMSYSFVNTFDYTNSAGVRVNSDPLNAITFEPGIKFIGNLKNGWQPYAGVSVVWNAIDKTKFKANDVSLPELSIKPYVRYGVGLRKTWGDRFTGFLQAFITNGGRNGVGLQAGFSWTLGKDTSNGALRKTNNDKPTLPKTDITLNNAK